VSGETRADSRRGRADAPSKVEITIVTDAAARPVRQRIGFALAVAMAVAVALLAVVLTVGGGAVSSGGGASHGNRAAAGVAAASVVPPRCVAVTIVGDRGTYIHADFDRAGSCGPYAGVANAMFHRADGVWRPRAQAAASPSTGPGRVRTGARAGSRTG
jgi:hypothetical protein